VSGCAGVVAGVVVPFHNRVDDVVAGPPPGPPASGLSPAASSSSATPFCFGVDFATKRGCSGLASPSQAAA
jgi:hypothetical protein